tara:strand:- start:1 stop:498 length:498 start_codon:yes stop_codon:yes gene_type:complete
MPIKNIKAINTEMRKLMDKYIDSNSDTLLQGILSIKNGKKSITGNFNLDDEKNYMNLFYSLLRFSSRNTIQNNKLNFTIADKLGNVLINTSKNTGNNTLKKAVDGNVQSEMANSNIFDILKNREYGLFIESLGPPNKDKAYFGYKLGFGKTHNDTDAVILITISD